MSRRFKIKGRAVVEVAPQVRPKFLDVRRIYGSRFYVTELLLPLTSAELRAAADQALIAELEASIKEPKK